MQILYQSVVGVAIYYVQFLLSVLVLFFACPSVLQ
jgi:hypothetical protein